MKKSIKYFAIAIALITGVVSAQDFSAVWKTRFEAAGVSIDTGNIGLLIYKNPPVLRVVFIGHSFRFTLVHEYPICAIGGEYGQKMRAGDGKTPEGFYYTYASSNKSPRFQIFGVFENDEDALVKNTHWYGISIHSGCISRDGCIAISDSSFPELGWLLGERVSVPALILPFESDTAYYDRVIAPSARSNPAEFRHLLFVRALNVIVMCEFFPITMERGDYATIASGMPEYTWGYIVDDFPPFTDIPYLSTTWVPE